MRFTLKLVCIEFENRKDPTFKFGWRWLKTDAAKKNQKGPNPWRMGRIPEERAAPPSPLALRLSLITLKNLHLVLI